MRNKIKHEEKKGKREKKEYDDKLKKEKIKEKEDLMLKYGILYEYNHPEVVEKTKRKIKTNSRRLKRRRERIEDLKNLSQNHKRNDPQNKNKEEIKDYIE